MVFPSRPAVEPEEPAALVRPVGAIARRVVGPTLAVVLLLLPALWNRFPLLQYDTGGYIARWYEAYLVPSRSTTFGLFLHATERLDYWPAVLIQAVLTVWIVGLVLRVSGLGGRPWRLAAVVGVLSVVTALPWLTSVLLTDIFAGLGVIALHLLVVRRDALGRAEAAGLALVVAFAAASHTATFAVLLALLAAGLAARVVGRPVASIRALGRGAAAIALGAALLLATNLALGRQLAWTPGGFTIPFGRMLQDGIVARYLEDHCGQRSFRLCPHRHDLPATADDFLWGDSVFNQLGRFAGLSDEMRAIVLGSLAAYPLRQAETAAVATLSQLGMNATGEGVHDKLWHTYGIVERFVPAMAPRMRAARQQRGELDFALVNGLHRPVAVLSIVLTLGLVGWAATRGARDDLALLAASVSVALLANAFVCGALSGPHDRYGARLVWIATLVGAMAAMRAWQAVAAAAERDGAEFAPVAPLAVTAPAAVEQSNTSGTS